MDPPDDLDESAEDHPEPAQDETDAAHAESGPTGTRLRRWRTPLVVAVAVALGASIPIVITSVSDNGDTSSGSSPSIVGEPLPTNAATRDDGLGAALGQFAPRLVGQSLDGSPMTVSPGGGSRQAVVFLAHWCVQCQREVRAIVALAERGELRGIEVTAVLTATSRNRANYPPSEWLARERWPYPTFADNSSGTAADAYGVTTVPMIVLADGDARVVARLADFRDDDALRVMREFAAAPTTTT